jgi:hypothetical protein
MVGDILFPARTTADDMPYASALPPPLLWFRLV